jgi:hypothetical protein
MSPARERLHRMFNSCNSLRLASVRAAAQTSLMKKPFASQRRPESIGPPITKRRQAGAQVGDAPLPLRR